MYAVGAMFTGYGLAGGLMGGEATAAVDGRFVAKVGGIVVGGVG